MKQKIKLVLPAYNEQESLGSLLQKVIAVKNNFNLPLTVLVVNDGSKDNTLSIAKSFGPDVEALDLQPNRGLAGALREGLKFALADMSDQDILITMDADDSHNPGLIFRMITQIWEGSDIVIASRYRNGSRIVGLSAFREFLSSFARYLFAIFRPIRGVRDYTCGYRAYKTVILKKAYDHYKDRFIEQQGFGCMAEILLKLKTFKPIVHELPFILRYDQKRGASKMNVWKTVKQTLGLIFSVKTK
jgi:dolichol-phosphate mannosyltransferase